MSIQTELTRITNAKAAIKAAIEGKGVTVPGGTLLDGMASLIESIEAGGGSGGGDGGWAIDGFTFLSGTFTPEADITSGYYKIKVGRYTTKPTQVYSALYIINGFPDGSTTKHGVAAIGTTMMQHGSYSNYGAYLSAQGGGTNPSASILGATAIAKAMNNELYMNIYTNECYLIAGVTYGWIFIHN